MPLSLTTPPAHGGQRHLYARLLGRQPSDFLDFSANLNPLGPPQEVLAALASSLLEIAHYPDPAALAATEAVAQYLGLGREHVLLTSGGMAALALVAGGLPIRVGVVVEPAFGGYREALASEDVPYRGHLGPVEELLDAPFDPGTLLVLGQPANPTGRLTPRGVLLGLAEHLARRGGWLLLDEAFIDFLPDADQVSFRGRAAEDSTVVVVGSLTKFFTLPGLRLGYLVGTRELVRHLAARQLSWSVGSLPQVAAVAATNAQAFIEESRTFFPPVRRALAQSLAATGLFDVTEGSANYLLLDARPSGRPAAHLAALSAERGVLVRDASNFPGLSPYHLRVAVRTPEENERLVSVLTEAAEARGTGPA
jgi:threonine-phosphate decarboxylase